MLSTNNDTVYSRMKKTGYITGPRHRMNPGMEDMQPQDTPATDGPPNLRDAPEPESCGDCANFRGNQCGKFNTSVTPNQVCDDFEEGAPDNGEESTSTEIPQVPGPEAQ